MFHSKPKAKEKEKEKNTEIEMVSDALYVPQAETKEEKTPPISNALIETRLASLYNILARIMQNTYSLEAPLITRAVVKHYSHKKSPNQLLVTDGFLSKKCVDKEITVRGVLCSADDFPEIEKTFEKQSLVKMLTQLYKSLSRLPNDEKLIDCLAQIAEFGKLIVNDLGLAVSQPICKLSPADDVVRLEAVQAGVDILQAIAVCYGYHLPEAKTLLQAVVNDIKVKLLYRAELYTQPCYRNDRPIHWAC